MLNYFEMKKIKEFSKRNRILIIIFFVIFLTGCAKNPEINMIDYKGEGYFMGILQPYYECFVPMEYVLIIKNDLTYFNHLYFLTAKFQYLSYRFFFRHNHNKQIKNLSDYDYYFVIVKGKIVDHYPDESSSFIKQKNYLRIDKIVYLKVVDKEFVKCLLDKTISLEKYENYYLKHPKEILKLCPCKPLKEIEKRKNIAFL